MYHNMRRLHPRGAASRGICVDAEGAILGPDCVLVERTPNGFRAIGRDEASALQKCLLDSDRDRDWLFDRCQRIADLLDKGDLALAQIYGLHIPIGDLNDLQLKRIAAISGLRKAGFNPDEPRIPKGDPYGGEWTTGDGIDTAPSCHVAPSAVPLRALDVASTDTNRPPPMEFRIVSPDTDTASHEAAPERGQHEERGASEASGGGKGEATGLGGILPVADFSGGFHDAVVDLWMDYFQQNEVPVVKTPAIRVIGTNNSVIGFPDMVVVLPGVGLAVIEVKTGEIPTYTPNQTAYFPLIQIGDHIYTTDIRISRLGLTPGVPFPSMPVYILHAPGPGRQYEVLKLSPPQFEP